MKKTFIIFASILSLFLVSCGKKIDSSVWLSNLEDAKKIAKSENKRIFLFFSEDEGDEKSSKLKESVFNQEDFIKTYTEKYVLVNLDYSNSRFENENDVVQKELKYFELYDVSTTPFFLILSKEGYVVSKLAFEKNSDLETAKITFNDAEEQIIKFEDLIAKTKEGSKEDRLAAINLLYDMTDPNLTYHLSPLSELYLSLDKNNASGDSLRHLISLTYKKASDYLFENKQEKAAEEFSKLAKNKILSTDDKQMAYYTAGYLLASSGSENLKLIQSYFQQAYDVAPESENAQNIMMALNYVQMMIDGEGDVPQNYDVPNSPEVKEEQPVTENPQN